ncbi:MAG: retroviral-like aspartic protease family protein [Nitrososphaeria archaeon]
MIHRGAKACAKFKTSFEHHLVRMGFVKVRVKVWNIENPKQSRELELLADTGAIYTVLPSSLLKELGIKAINRRKFKLANNEVVEKDVGLMGVEIEGKFTYTIVVFGEENVYLLGVTTLEELGLEVDPVKGVLRPMELLLM